MCNCDECLVGKAANGAELGGASAIGPAPRLLALFLFAAAVVGLSNRPALLVATASILVLALLLRVPRLGASRLAWLLPFGLGIVVTLPFVTPGPVVWRLDFGHLGLAATSAGLIRAEVSLLRLLAIALATGVLLETTGTAPILSGLRTLRVPGLLVDLIGFALRYTTVLADETRRMLVARQARGFETRRRCLIDWQTLRTYGSLLGVLFERAYERSERLYLAMLARSYGQDSQGKDEREGFGSAGWILCGTTLAVCLALILWDRSMTL